MADQNDASADVDYVVSSVSKKLKSLPSPPNWCSIFKVPLRLREKNVGAYTPQMVSIGPLHHGKKELQAMEEHKERYLQYFLEKSKVSREDILRYLKEKEKSIRDCYAEVVDFSSDELVEMIMVDAAFIIEVLLSYCIFPERQDEYDVIFGKPALIHDLWYDFWLLENQLPFFVLQDILEISRISVYTGYDAGNSLVILTYKFLRDGGRTDDFRKIYAEANACGLFSNPIEHFVDLQRKCFLPSNLDEQAKTPLPKGLLAIILPSATRLRQAGVQIKLAASKNPFDVSFRDGILELPNIKMTSVMETYCRNILAFERHFFTDNYINDYIILLDRLVDTHHDVNLLVEKGIIEIRTGDSKEVAELINNLGKVVTFGDNYYFSDVLKNLDLYCNHGWSRWKANARRDFFCSPEAFLSRILAVSALILTSIQTITSIMSAGGAS